MIGYEQLDAGMKKRIKDIVDNANTKAPIISPAFTGIPTAPTASTGTNTTQIATTSFVHNILTQYGFDGTSREVTGNWNDCKTSGFYRGNGLTNSPTGVSGINTWFYVIVTKHNDTYISQIAIDFNGIGLFKRVCANGTWSSWARIYSTTDKPSKADVGLGNVDNESKATMFTNAALTGTPTAPTASVGTNTTQIATTAFVKTAVSNVIGSAPSGLDTLQEIATSIGNDTNFVGTVNDKLATKAPLASPALTGTPTAPTATAGTNTTQIATTAFVRKAVADLVGSSPASLDTLQELATALGNDANFATTVTNNLATKAPLASPALTGTPTAPTASNSTNNTQIATTAFVKTAVSSGNSATATKLATARTIALTGSVTGSGTFDGSGDLSITTTTSHTHNYAGSASAGGPATTALTCTGNSATATKLATARTIALTGSVTGSGSFDGSGNLSITTTTNHTHSYAGSSSAGGAATTALACTGNSATATKLASAVTINGISFDGSANIVTPTITNSGNIILTADSDSSTTTEYGMLKAGGNELKVISSGGGTSPATSNTNLTYNGNVIYHAGNKPTKSDVGLSNVTNESKATMFTNAALTGTPTAPTAASGTNTTQIATTAFVRKAVSDLVGSSPTALDTLQELASALGNDPNFATTVTNNLATKAPLASPALTGTPTAPTASVSTINTQIATTAFVKALIDSIVGTATLSTTNKTVKEAINELYNRPTFTSGTSAPSSARTNDLWIDTTNNLFKLKTSSGWVSIGAVYN